MGFESMTSQERRIAESDYMALEKLSKKTKEVGDNIGGAEFTPVNILHAVLQGEISVNDAFYVIFRPGFDVLPGLSDVFRLFAADCAERALYRNESEGYRSDVRCWDVVRGIRLFVEGKISDADLFDRREDAIAAVWENSDCYGINAECSAAWAAYKDAGSAASLAAFYARFMLNGELEMSEVVWQVNRLIELLSVGNVRLF